MNQISTLPRSLYLVVVASLLLPTAGFANAGHLHKQLAARMLKNHKSAHSLNHATLQVAETSHLKPGERNASVPQEKANSTQSLNLIEVFSNHAKSFEGWLGGTPTSSPARWILVGLLTLLVPALVLAGCMSIAGHVNSQGQGIVAFTVAGVFKGARQNSSRDGEGVPPSQPTAKSPERSAPRGWQSTYPQSQKFEAQAYVQTKGNVQPEHTADRTAASAGTPFCEADPRKADQAKAPGLTGHRSTKTDPTASTKTVSYPGKGPPTSQPDLSSVRGRNQRLVMQGVRPRGA
eukprot:TRINITY_DN5259_c0_g1_i1.p1 TRINITY_DN5259_c0_g1~~TRINITY_DN5259_c0_g1_i1.p1  ORF type:complete len:291 (-),score=42.12 TRINITY_DN5259_c0_g1_i1:163-1035(-)